MEQNPKLACSIEDIALLLNLCLTEDRLNEIIISTEDNISLLHTCLKVKYHYILTGHQKQITFCLYNILKKFTKTKFDDVSAILKLSMLVQNVENVTVSIEQYLQEIDTKLEDIDVILKLLFTITDVYSVYKVKLPYCLNDSLIQSLYVNVYNGNSKSSQNLFCKLLIKYVTCKSDSTNILQFILSFNDLYTISCSCHIFTRSTRITESSKFWLMIMDNIKSSDYNRKLALCILREYIHYASKSTCKLDIIKGNTQSDTEMTKCWSDYFTLMEISQEKSFHLIVPALALIPNVVTLHSSWVICLYKVLLSHSHTGVVLYVANSILESIKIDNSEIFEGAIQSLLPALNRYDYSDNFFEVFQKLKQLSTRLNDDQFSILFKESFKITWSSVSAWYFYASIIVGRYYKCDIDYGNILDIFNQIKILSHPFIRNSCQTLMLQFFIKQNWFTHFTINEFLGLAVDLKRIDPKLLPKFYQLAERNILAYNRNKDLLRKLNDVSPYSAVDEIEIMLQIADANTENVSTVENAMCARIINYEISDHLILYLCKYGSKKLILFDHLEQKLLSKCSSTNSFALCKIANYVKIDNANSNLLQQCKNILCGPDMFNENSIILAFEIYSNNTDMDLENVVKFWYNKFLNGYKIESKVCKFYLKVYFKYLIDIEKDILSEEIYQMILIIFDTHGEDVWLDVYENLDTILNKLQDNNILRLFLAKLLKELDNIRCTENLVAAWSAFIKAILNTNILENNDINSSIVPRIFQIATINETLSYIFINAILNAANNIVLLFIDLIVDLVLHGSITKKDKRCEFYTCKDIGRILNIPNKNNPNYIHTNIRTAAVNTIFRIMNDNGQAVANLVAKQCLERYRKDFKKRYFPDSEIHLSKLRIAQLLLILTPHVSDDWKTSIIDLMIESFCEESHQPCVKQLMQWLLILLSLEDYSHCKKIFSRMDTSSRTHTSTIAAFVTVLCHVGFNCDEETVENIIQDMLEWTMGAHFKLRVYAQVGICKLIEVSSEKKYNRILLKYHAFHESIKKVLKKAGSNIDNVLQTDKVFLNQIDVRKHYNLHSIYIDIPKLNNVIETEWGYVDLQLLYHCKTVPVTGYTIDMTNVTIKGGSMNNITVDYSVNNVQKKILPTIDNAIVDENEDTHRTELILIASLVDSAANLGGIARTCEIYGVKKLVVSDKKIINDKEFKSLSVSSEQWLHVSEVKRDVLEEYLERMKNEGYIAIGLEQTANSIKLHNYNLPKKCMVVLGNEKEGIASRIFPFLDVCIEIPQFGLLRSLNVHVAGAITIWEYVKQNIL